MDALLRVTLTLFLLPLLARAQTTISTLTPSANGTYVPGQNLDFVVTWSAPVTVTGLPRLALNVNESIRYAHYLQGSGTAQITFRYPVVPGIEAPAGIGVAFPVQPNGGAITDGNGAAADRGAPNRFFPGIRIQAPPPSIVSVTAPTPQAGRYLAGQSIDFQVRWSEAMNASANTSRLRLNVGGILRAANLVAGSGTTVFTYRLVIPVESYDDDGPTLLSPLDLNGSTITSVATGVAPGRTFAPPALGAFLIDGRVPTVVANTRAPDGTYKTGQTLSFTLTYSRQVTVAGNPRVQLNVGYPPFEVTRFADYVSGSGSTQLLFRYTVQSSDSDADGVFFNQWINLDAGSIVDEVGNSAAYAFWGMKLASYGESLLFLNLSPAPVIAAVTGPAAGEYAVGSALNFTVATSEPVTVTGSPRLRLTIGAATRYATFVSGSGTSSLTFRYVAALGDNGALEVASPLELNGGVIRDVDLNSLALTFTPPSLSGVTVNTRVTLGALGAPAPGFYGGGAALNFTAQFSAPVTVSGTPGLTVVIGAIPVTASYVSGSGTSTLLFRYTVTASDQDLDGVALVSPLNTGSGGIVDASGTAAVLTFAPPDTTGVRVAGTTFITGVSPPADGAYRAGQVLDFVVNYTGPATVTGSPRIQLTVGASTLYATYLSGSGRAAHVFRYTVSAGQNDANGIETVGPAILLNGGTIRDAVGKNVNLSFTPAAYPLKRVDTSAPTIAAVGVSPNAVYTAGQNINFTATYIEPVSVTGAPRLTLTVGSTTAYATYAAGSGTTQLVFRYTVPAGALDTNGIAVSRTLALNGGSIADGAGNVQSQLTFVAPPLAGVLVDAIAPTISAVAPPVSGTYRAGGVLAFSVTFNEAVTVTGVPALQLRVGTSTANATYQSGSGTATLVFRYTVAAGDNDADGVSTLSPIVLNGGSIVDLIGNAAVLRFTPTTIGTVRVDTAAPAVASVALPPDAVYRNGGARPQLNFAVTYAEAVTVSGVPRLHLTIGATPVFATYTRGTGTAVLSFRYSVGAGDTDLDGISVDNGAAIDLNGGSIADAAGNAAALYLGPLATGGIKVIFSTATRWYDVSDPATLTFSGLRVTRIADKIGTYTLTHSSTGAAYSATDFGGGTNAFVSCTASTWFNGATQSTPTAMVAVFRTPPTATSQFLFYTGAATRPMVQFSSLAAGGTVAFGVSGRTYRTGAWSAAAMTATNLWAPGTVTARAFSWPTTQTQAQSVCRMDGELAEAIFFSAQPTAAQMELVNTYLADRYDLAFPLTP
jgi:hypothetical protein